MNKVILFLFLIFGIRANGQIKDSCDIWSNKPYYNTIDTIKTVVKFVGTTESRYEHVVSSKDPCFAFYIALQKKYNLLDGLMFQPIGCDKIYNYPNSNKKEYNTKLYHKHNDSGVYEDIQDGRLIEITSIRFNRTYKDYPELITIITDVKILDSYIPIKVPK